MLYSQLSGGGVELLHSNTDQGYSTMGDKALYNRTLLSCSVRSLLHYDDRHGVQNRKMCALRIKLFCKMLSISLHLTQYVHVQAIPIHLSNHLR